MREQLENRLQELRAELEIGQKVMAELEVREANLRSTLLRIGGAVQVLEELLGDEQGAAIEAGAALRAGHAAVAAE
ncbi:MAG: hypothetical protein DMF67_02980 [Acidobacteria bacterium]|nr:MAG: hypothetical protein DMF66_12780 [Acidobacteriota bacterium]PYS84986.1 MAG: hypothetical protein DMF67_02980 [Acidobacteriota bacterium]